MKFYLDIETKDVVTKRAENRKYRELKANEIDAALEKHVPVYEVIENQIKVKVGSVEHPMLEDHYIMWIAMDNNGKLIKRDLSPGNSPTAVFEYVPGSTIYAYCNLHGLWKKDVK